jgi:uncharacterized membrane protein YeaQ/YmgE (transglycosylase-associated protein family)
MKTILQWFGKKMPESYRTKVGGIGLIALGLIGALNLIWEGLVPGCPPMALEECIAAFSGGFIAIGIGRKIDQNTAAVKATAP